VSAGALEALTRSLQANTLKHYNGYLARFELFCSQAGVSAWRDAPLALVLDFLCSLVRGVERPATVLDTAVAALRQAFTGASGVMDSPWIGRLKKGLVVAHTTRVRNVTQPIPAEPICNWLRRLRDNDLLSFKELRRKVAVLAAMALIARPSDLTHIEVGSLQVQRDGLEMTVNLLAFKNDYHRDGASLVVTACSEAKLCFIRASMCLLQRLRDRFQRPAALFTQERLNKPLSAASVGRLLKEACTAAGIGDVFSGRNFRPGGATRGLAGGLPLDLVMHIGRWRDPSTVYGHYVRSERPATTTDVLLGIRSGNSALDATTT
jgi:site-specific recombinase XerD